MTRAAARVWILFAWIVGVSLLLPPTAECFVSRVMRSALWRQSFWSRRFTGVVAAAPNPSTPSAQSYLERHSRLFSSSPILSSTTMNENGNGKALPREYTDYEKWVRRLYMTNLFHPVKMGLTNMQQLHDIMGNPMDDVSGNMERYRLTCHSGSLLVSLFDIITSQIVSSFMWLAQMEKGVSL